MARKKVRIFGFFLLALAIAGWVFYVKPVKTRIFELQEEMRKKTEEVATLESRLAELSLLEQELPQSDEERKRLLIAFPDTLNEDQIVQYFDTLGRRYSVTFGTLNFESGNELAPGISTLLISGSFEGEYVNLIKFLGAVEQSRRRIVVTSINAEVADAKASSFYLKMEAYYQH